MGTRVTLRVRVRVRVMEVKTHRALELCAGQLCSISSSDGPSQWVLGAEDPISCLKVIYLANASPAPCTQPCMWLSLC